MTETLRQMNTRKYRKIVHDGDYVAQVDVELLYADEDGLPIFLWGTRIDLTMFETPLIAVLCLGFDGLCG